METTQADLVLVPLDRQGASVLADAAQVGLDGADEDTTGHSQEALDAGSKALTDLRRALAVTPDDEVAVVANGIAALDSLLAHPPALTADLDRTLNPSIMEDEYVALFNLRGLLRDSEVDRVE